MKGYWGRVNSINKVNSVNSTYDYEVVKLNG